MRSYFTFLSRNRVYTGIEILGLSVSLAFIILLVCHIRHEISIPTMIPGYENTYLIHIDDSPVSSYDTGEQLKESLPEITDICRIHPPCECQVSTGEQVLYNIEVCGMENNWITFFPTEVTDGSLDDFIDGRNAIITRKMADRLFGNDRSAVGQNIIIENQTYTVIGVINPANLQLFSDFDIIVNLRSPLFKEFSQGHKADQYSVFITFLKTTEECDEEQLARKWDDYARTRWKTFFEIGWKNKTGVTRLDRLYFCELDFFYFRHGSKKMLYILCSIAIGLFLSALINYINLGVALVGKRAKEMAIRRLLGSSRNEIRLRYFKESLFLTGTCFMLGLGLAYIIAPDFYQLIDARPNLLNEIDGWHIGLYLLIVLLTAGLASMLPGLMVSKLQPIDVVRGTFRLKNKMILSKIFIVVQIVLAIVLIAVTLTMHHQIEYMSARPNGLNNPDIFILGTEIPIKDELSALPCVKRIGKGYVTPGISKHIIGTSINDEHYQIIFFALDTIAFQIIGLDIQETYKRPLNYSSWLTRTTANTFGISAEHTDLPKPLTRINLKKDDPDLQLGGIIGDILTAPIWAENNLIPTIIHVYNRPEENDCQTLLIETIGPHDEAQTAIRDCYTRLADKMNVSPMPDYCDYLSEIFKEQLRPLRRTARLVTIFTGVALLIALLGLIAMSHYYTRQRTMEIAVRKIYGATRSQIQKRLSRGYFALIGLSAVIALPIATSICQRYLENYAYRIAEPVGELICAVVITSTVAVLAVVWQIFRAASANPVDTIKKE